MKRMNAEDVYELFNTAEIKVPRVLFSPPFEGLSNDARILYGMLLERIELSYDDPAHWNINADVFVYFPRKEVMQRLHVGQQKATDTFKELETADLITREQQKAERKPDKIYLCDWGEEQMNIERRKKGSEDPKKQMISYITIPWGLFEKPYDGLSNNARILYGLIRNRWRLSSYARFVYFPQTEAMEILKVKADKTVSKLYKNLEEVELIKRVRQGFGKPDKIYLTNEPWM